MNTHSTLVSLAVSAMFSSALLATAPNPYVAAATGPQPQEVLHSVEGLSSAGWQTPPDMSLPRPTRHSEIPQPLPLTQAQFQELLVYLGGPRGKDLDLNPIVATAFGIPPTESARGFALKTAKGLKFEFTRLGDDKGFLIGRKEGTSARMLLLDTNLSLIGGIILEDGQDPVAMPTEAAKSTFQTDLTTWGRIADMLANL